MMVVLPVLMVPVFMMPVAVLAGLFVMVVMLLVYHSSVHFPSAKVRRPACNQVAKVAGIRYLAGD
jgi:hypothetical protein